jgi:hypothetical protein
MFPRTNSVEENTAGNQASAKSYIYYVHVRNNKGAVIIFLSHSFRFQAGKEATNNASTMLP